MSEFVQGAAGDRPMSTMLKRDPKGAFIWQGQALDAWLPLLLRKASGGALERLLEIGARYCCEEAAEELQRSARFLVDPQIQLASSEELYWHNVKRAELLGRKRAILVRALKELREVK